MKVEFNTNYDSKIEIEEDLTMETKIVYLAIIDQDGNKSRAVLEKEDLRDLIGLMLHIQQKTFGGRK